jgi:hypothetical protein
MFAPEETGARAITPAQRLLRGQSGRRDVFSYVLNLVEGVDDAISLSVNSSVMYLPDHFGFKGEPA